MQQTHTRTTRTVTTVGALVVGLTVLLTVCSLKVEADGGTEAIEPLPAYANVQAQSIADLFPPGR